MSNPLSSVVLAGSTGLVGSQILKTLIDLPSGPKVHALTRKPLPHSSPQVSELRDSDSNKWPNQIQSLPSTPAPDAFITALGTTKAAAGSFDTQYKIEHDLNIALAKAALAQGTKIAVLISSSGGNAKSRIPYMRMKGEIEESFKEMGFEYCVLVRPGLLMGTREESRPAEAVVRKIADGLGKVSHALIDFWAQDSGVIAKAVVSAAMQCQEGKREKGVWALEQAEIVRLGRTEWKGT